MLIEIIAQPISDSAVIGDYDTIKRVLDKSILGSQFAEANFIDLSGGGTFLAQTGAHVARIRLQLDRFLEKAAVSFRLQRPADGRDGRHALIIVSAQGRDRQLIAVNIDDA